ncbi:MAG: nuclear transport factor 2 family protein [Chitinophagaceae bacterium]
MRYFIIWLFTISTAGHALAQADTADVLRAVDQLEKALVAKDAPAVEALLHEEVYFGHSNGWVQTKSEVIRDMNSGYLNYRSFDRESLTITRMNNRALVKAFVKVEGDRNQVPFQVRLFVLQEWVKQKGGWRLVVRQGAKQS